VGRPKKGFRLFKGSGTRLLRSLPDNDWINTQTGEGYEGWKKPYVFNRTYAYQEADGAEPARHLYRVEAVTKKGLYQVAKGYGRTSDLAWEDLYKVMKAIGAMPKDATE
jgi:seryl-tRNA synthetase